jgi:predicted nucleic acid-binding Zn ribbon protein
MEQTCTHCKESKPVSCFYLNQQHCIECGRLFTIKQQIKRDSLPERKCPKCKLTKDRSSFYKGSVYCKECSKVLRVMIERAGVKNCLRCKVAKVLAEFDRGVGRRQLVCNTCHKMAEVQKKSFFSDKERFCLKQYILLNGVFNNYDLKT